MIVTAPLETSILASIMVDGRKSLSLMPELSVKDFTLAANRDIFAAAVRLDQDDSRIAYDSVGAELMGNAPAVRALADIGDAPPLSHLAGIYRQLKTALAIMHASNLGRRLTALAEADQSVVLLGERLTEIARIGQEVVALGALKNRDESVVISLAEIAQAEITELEKIIFGAELPERMTTGVGKLDEVVTLHPGQLVVVGGGAGSGKSSLCAQIAVAVAQRKDPVIFITSEMSHREMLARMAAAITGKSVKDLVDRKTAVEIEAHLTYHGMVGLPIDFQRSFPPRIEEAVAAIRTAVSRRGAKLAIIDYAQRLASLEDDMQERAISKIAHEAKNMALELGIVVIAAAQINRQGSTRSDPRPVLSDLRGSGALEQNADIVMFCHQPSHYGKQGPPTIIVAKQRNGPTGEIPVVFDAQSCFFRSAVRQ